MEQYLNSCIFFFFFFMGPFNFSLHVSSLVYVPWTFFFLFYFFSILAIAWTLISPYKKKKIMMYFMPINLYLCIYIIFNACLFSLFFKKSFIYNYWCKPISIISGFSLVQQYFKKYIDKSVILLSNWFRFTLCFSFLGESEMDLLSDLPVKDPLSKPFDFGK